MSGNLDLKAGHCQDAAAILITETQTLQTIAEPGAKKASETEP